MKKILALLIAIILVLGALIACSKQNKEEPSLEETIEQDSTTPINIVALNGPTGMGMAFLNKNSDEGKTKYKYSISYANSPDEVTGQLIAGNIDIAAVPINLASVLFNKTNGEILTCALNTLGVLYIVENGNTINSINDLEGKTIIASGKGSTPEYILNYLLDKEGLLDKVNVEYVAEHDEAVSALASGSADIIMIPEPKVTAALTKIEGARIALDLTKEWNNKTHSKLIQGVLVVRKTFADEHPDIVNTFLDEYKLSVEFTNEHPKESSKIIAEYKIIPNEQMALKALPNCHIVYIDGDEMETSMDETLSILYEANPKSVGGKLPDKNIYYKK